MSEKLGRVAAEIQVEDKALIANILCSEGICGGDQSSVPCERSRRLAAYIVDYLQAMGIEMRPRK